MKKLFAVALGVLTAIGGFVDIGDLVTNAVVGSRFGMSLAWVVVVGVVGICLFANMSGRVEDNRFVARLENRILHVPSPPAGKDAPAARVTRGA